MAAALTTLVVLAAGARATFLSLPETYPNLTACAALGPVDFSCEAAPPANTCCSPTPGGLVLQTQFWSTYTGLEDEGQLLPKGSWTIHGLWPDNCDGCV